MTGTKTLISFFFFLSLCIISCVQTKFLQTGETFARWTDSVKIYQNPPGDIAYIEIGWVTAYMNNLFSDWGVILKAMQREASIKGANGLILIDKVKLQQAAFCSTRDRLFADSYDEKSLIAIAI